MSARKDSFDEYNSTCDDTTIIGDDLNRAMLVSFNDTLSETSDSFSTTLSTIRSSKIDSKIVETQIQLADKSCKPTIISDEILVEPCNVPKKKAFISRIPRYTCKKSQHQITEPKDDRVSSNVGEANKFFNIETISTSDLWPALTVLEETLNTSHENTLTDNVKVLEKLNVEFGYSPRTFTESLVTIIEESFVEIHEKSGNASTFWLLDFFKQNRNAGTFLEEESPSKCVDSLTEEKKTVGDEQTGNSSDPGLRRLLKEADKVTKRLENESPPECNISLPSESQVRTDPSLSNSNYSESENVVNTPFTDESTQYSSYHGSQAIASTVKITTIDDKTFEKTPTIIINPATPTNVIMRLAKKTSKSRRTLTPTKKIYKKTPKVHADAGGSEGIVDRLTESSVLSPSNSDDEDEYLTAESETEESSNKKLNMSNIASKHQEWLKTYDKISRYKLGTFDNLSAVTERNRKLSTHTNKLERRWLKELNKKRRKCFDLVDEILQKPVVEAKEPEVQSPCFSPPCKISKELCRILSACYEYIMCAKNTSEICESKKKKGGHFVTSLTMNLKSSKCLSPRKPSTTAKKYRTSLGKSTGARLVSNRCTKFTPSPSKRRSRGVSSTKMTQATPLVDTSSIRPVSQLRRVFSPREETAGCFESKIPGGNKIKPTKNSAIIGRVRKGTVRLIPSPVSGILKKVVSPVGEYIRGKKVA